MASHSAGSPWRDGIAGAGLGLFTGLLIGLSVTDVVGSILAALLALLGAFFGLRAPPAEDGGAAERVDGRAAHPWRIAAFGAFAALALIAGISLRGHALLSQPIAAQMKELQSAGFTLEQSQEMVAFRRFGIKPTGREVVDDIKAQRSQVSALFTGRAETCGQLSAERFDEPRERLNAFVLAGGNWELLAGGVAADIAPERLAAALDAAWTLACDGVDP